MLNNIYYILNNLFNSLNTKDGNGWSARKLSAFAGVCIAIHSTARIIDAAILRDVIYGWQLFITVCLGLVTIPELIKFLKSNDSNISQQTNNNG